MFVVDTDAISSAAAIKAKKDVMLADWLLERSTALRFSEATLLEVQAGISKLLQLGATSKASIYQAWFGALLFDHSARFVPLDRAVLTKAGELRGVASAKGFTVSEIDCCIAATGVLNGWPIATRNVSHFRHLGVPVFRRSSDRDRP